MTAQRSGPHCEYQNAIRRRFDSFELQSIIALLVQMFFAWRVKVLTNSWPPVILIAFCSFCQWCMWWFSVSYYFKALTIRLQVAAWELPLPVECKLCLSYHGPSEPLTLFPASRSSFTSRSSRLSSSFGWRSQPWRIRQSLWHSFGIWSVLAFIWWTHYLPPSQRKHKTGFSSTDDIVDKIIRSKCYEHMCLRSPLTFLNQ